MALVAYLEIYNDCTYLNTIMTNKNTKVLNVALYYWHLLQVSPKYIKLIHTTKTMQTNQKNYMKNLDIKNQTIRQNIQNIMKIQ